MSINSEEELKGMTAISEIVGNVLKLMREYTEIGMSTKEIDEYGFSILKEHGANPAPFKDYQFPGYTCISVNQEACHGIPSKRKILKEGDLINIDVSAEKGGYYGDNGGSFIVGKDIQNLQPLVDASQEILHLAIKQITDNVSISDVGGFISMEAKKRGFQVIKNLCGHGIGHKLHENPREIACYRDRLNRERFKKNSVIALETFISTKANYVYEGPDNWTMSAEDGSFVAQHEHTIIVTDGAPIILTANNGI